MGEELQELGLNDLMKVEKLVESGLSRVGKMKVSLFIWLFHLLIIYIYILLLTTTLIKSFPLAS